MYCSPHADDGRGAGEQRQADKVLERWAGSEQRTAAGCRCWIGTNSMAMRVVHVREVRVLVAQPLVTVPMGMRLAS